MKASTKIITAVSDGDINTANEAFATAVKEKINTILDIKKIELTSRVFDKATAK